VRVLVDEDLDVRLRNHFGDAHEAITVRHEGWSGLTNGELLTAASAEFDVLVTADSNLQHQQNLSQYDIAVLVLRAPTKRLVDLAPLMPAALRLLPDLKPGTATEVHPPMSTPSSR
jgi:predicted nuclease of predicted toxin-antitoxin system